MTDSDAEAFPASVQDRVLFHKLQEPKWKTAVFIFSKRSQRRLRKNIFCPAPSFVTRANESCSQLKKTNDFEDKNTVVWLEASPLPNFCG